MQLSISGKNLIRQHPPKLAPTGVTLTKCQPQNLQSTSRSFATAFDGSAVQIRSSVCVYSSYLSKRHLPPDSMRFVQRERWQIASTVHLSAEPGNRSAHNFVIAATFSLITGCDIHLISISRAALAQLRQLAFLCQSSALRTQQGRLQIPAIRENGNRCRAGLFERA